jgi:hypothetical protein
MRGFLFSFFGGKALRFDCIELMKKKKKWEYSTAKGKIWKHS